MSVWESRLKISALWRKQSFYDSLGRSCVCLSLWMRRRWQQNCTPFDQGHIHIRHNCFVPSHDCCPLPSPMLASFHMNNGFPGLSLLVYIHHSIESEAVCTVLVSVSLCTGVEHTHGQWSSTLLLGLFLFVFKLWRHQHWSSHWLSYFSHVAQRRKWKYSSPLPCLGTSACTLPADCAQAHMTTLGTWSGKFHKLCLGTEQFTLI